MSEELPNGGQSNNETPSGEQGKQGQQEQTPPAPVKFQDLMTAADTKWQEYEKNPTPENKEAYLKVKTDAKTAYEAENKARADAEAKNVVPEKYDLKKPEGSLLSDEHITGIAEFAKAQGLTNEKAQALLNRESQLQTEAREAVVTEQAAQMTKLQEGWITTASNDKEYGGAEFAKNAELAKRVLVKFGTPEFNAILEDPKQGRFGNHPELLRVLVRIGKAMSEDQFISPGAHGGKKEVSVADKLYSEVQGNGVQK